MSFQTRLVLTSLHRSVVVLSSGEKGARPVSLKTRPEQCLRYEPASRQTLLLPFPIVDAAGVLADRIVQEYIPCLPKQLPIYARVATSRQFSLFKKQRCCTISATHCSRTEVLFHGRFLPRSSAGGRLRGWFSSVVHPCDQSNPRRKAAVVSASRMLADKGKLTKPQEMLVVYACMCKLWGFIMSSGPAFSFFFCVPFRMCRFRRAARLRG